MDQISFNPTMFQGCGGGCEVRGAGPGVPDRGGHGSGPGTAGARGPEQVDHDGYSATDQGRGDTDKDSCSVLFPSSGLSLLYPALRRLYPALCPSLVFIALSSSVISLLRPFFAPSFLCSVLSLLRHLFAPSFLCSVISCSVSFLLSFLAYPHILRPTLLRFTLRSPFLLRPFLAPFFLAPSIPPPVIC